MSSVATEAAVIDSLADDAMSPRAGATGSQVDVEEPVEKVSPAADCAYGEATAESPAPPVEVEPAGQTAPVARSKDAAPDPGLEADYVVLKQCSPAAADDPEYVVREWKRVTKSRAPTVPGADGIGMSIPPERLECFRRQVARLKKWSELSQAGKRNIRRHARRVFADVVHLVPLGPNKDGPAGPKRAAFCRDLSQGGCSLLHPVELESPFWGIEFPRASTPLFLRGEVIRQRRVVLGMFEIGIRFIGRGKETSKAPARESMANPPSVESPVDAVEIPPTAGKPASHQVVVEDVANG